MANAAVLAAPPAAPKKGAAPAVVVPFTRAAKEHVEPMFDVSQIITAGTVALGPFDIPAYGYLRHLILRVDATGGVSSVTTAAQQDTPWIAIQEVALIDVNGAPIVGPFSGYDLYLINKYGGYKFESDPRAMPSYIAPVVGASASGNFSFILRVPVELSGRDALGSLANQNASSTYKLRFTLNSSAAIYSTAPNTTLPTVRFRGWLEAWSQPPATDLRGHAQATTPPAHGTTGYWSKYVANIAAGANTIRAPRVGNYIRNMLFVYRAADGTRQALAQWPDPAAIFWDTRMLHSMQPSLWQHFMAERYGFTGTIDLADGLDTGVWGYDWCHEFDAHVGQELRDGWLPTVQSTRLELSGSFGVAGTLAIITNDVSPAGEVFL